MTISVRIGEPADRPLLARHASEGAAEQAAHRGRRDTQPEAETFLVGEIDEVPCGTLGWVVTGSALRIVHVYVEPWAREVGVGDRLMAETLDRARSAGAGSVGASALPGDRAMKNLFERNGLVAREILVERRLP